MCRIRRNIKKTVVEELQSLSSKHAVTHATPPMPRFISLDGSDIEAKRQEILDYFDKNVPAAREAIASTSDEQLAEPWTLMQGGEPVFTMPRAAILRSFVLNHNIHHRAHLCVYLRVNEVPVPALYGPSADEEGM